LTPAQHQLLLAIKGHPDRRGPTIRELAEWLASRHHSVVGLVDRAAAAGLVERAPDRTDGRVVRVRLTRLGNRRIDRLSAVHLRQLRSLAPLLGRLGTESRQSTPPD
jgi:DNA-binding MarR family transcriptional regulator